MGIGYLTGGESADAQIARSSYLHGPAADRIVARARALRETAGTLSGHALGQDPEDTDALGRPLVRDLIQVFGADEAQAHSDVLLARLAEQWPDTYAEMKPAALTAALRHNGLETRQMWALSVDGETRRGVAREGVAAAVAERDDTDEPG